MYLIKVTKFTIFNEFSIIFKEIPNVIESLFIEVCVKYRFIMYFY